MGERKVISLRDISVFNRDAWLPEHFERMAELILTGINKPDEIARRLDRGEGIETTANEVASALAYVKRKQNWHGPGAPDGENWWLMLKKEASDRRTNGRQPITPYEVDPPPAEIVPPTAAPHTSMPSGMSGSSTNGPIKLVIDGDQSREEIDPSKPVFLYLMKLSIGFMSWAKIGVSNCPERRAVDLTCGVPADVEIVKKIEIKPGYDPYKIEAAVHRTYPGRIRRELFTTVDVDAFGHHFYAALDAG